MNEKVRESTKENGEWGALYAITKLKCKVAGHYEFMIEYYFDEAVLTIEESKTWHYHDRKITQTSYENNEDVAIKVVRQSETEFIYRNEDVLSDGDILAKTI